MSIMTSFLFCGGNVIFGETLAEIKAVIRVVVRIFVGDDHMHENNRET